MIVCNFSCGAASAVATKLTIYDNSESEILILNAEIAEEHPDNTRFLLDCEKWFGMPVKRVRNEKYNASVMECILDQKIMLSRFGFAPCSKMLKRETLAKYIGPLDTVVLGYTADKVDADRYDRFLDANNGVDAVAPLIDAGLTKSDCLQIIISAGIEVPEMYKLGYSNANCIGCVKGGEGYWNKIRQDFPERFAEMARVEAQIGGKLFRNRKTGERYGLADLPPQKGRIPKAVIPECSMFCELAEKDIL